MLEPASVSEGSLRIVHILRSPVGGLFRHVLDLVDAQIARGHMVGVIADSSTGGRHADVVLDGLKPRLALGLVRLPMRRDPHPLDALAVASVSRTLRTMRPDVIHGHGAKGALYGRLSNVKALSGRRPIRVYTPHGGSLHYDPRSLKGATVLTMERLLKRRTDLILFESSFAAERFRDAVGSPSCTIRIVHNGLRAAEFKPVPPDAEAADFVFVGELRMLKGVDVLLSALARLGSTLGQTPRAVLVGDGPDRERFETMARDLGIAAEVDFLGPMPARDAFALGRVLVVPSRAESLPYIVLEAAAAQVPVIASRVGGIPEIFGGADEHLVPPDDVEALASKMLAQLQAPASRQAASSLALSRFIETRFNVGRMAEAVLGGYRDALAAQSGRTAAALRPASPGLSRYGF